MSGFYNKGVDIIQSVVGSPVGSISAYLGTTDPSGWVICDGSVRDNTSGTYNKLISMGIGTKVVANYYPPNFKGAFLRGIGGSGNYIGPSAVDVSQNDAFGEHNHAVYDAGHSHKISSDGDNIGMVRAGVTGYVYNAAPGQNNSTYWMKKVESGESGTNKSTVTSTTGIGIYNNGSVETRPYNFGVNWIIRY